MTPPSYCFASGVEVGERALRALLEAGQAPALILTYSEQLAHRSGYASLVGIARENGIPHVATSDINSDEVLEAIKAHRSDLLVVAGWSQIVRDEALSQFPLGGVGLHPTLLPEGRGRAPIPWTIIKRLTETGATLFRLLPAVDSGEVVGQELYTVSRRDDARSLYEKMTKASVKLLVEKLPELLQGTAASTPQEGTGSVWPRRDASDGVIDWHGLDAESIYDWVRALGKPYPGAFTHLESGERMVVWEAEFLEGVMAADAACGQVVGRLWSTKGGGIAVAAKGGGIVILTSVQVGDAEVVDGLSLLEQGIVNVGGRLV